MKLMIPCMKLDFMLLKPYIKSVILVLLVPLIYPAFTDSLLEGMSFAVIVLAMTTPYMFSIAEKNSMERLYGFLPVKSKNLVGGRYLAIFSQGFIFLLLEMAAQVLILAVAKSAMPPIREIVGVTLICVLLFTIYAGVQIPGYYKYGPIKGRIFMFVPSVCYLIFYFIMRAYDLRSLTGVSVLQQNMGILAAVVLAFVAIMLYASIFISLKVIES